MFGLKHKMMDTAGAEGGAGAGGAASGGQAQGAGAGAGAAGGQGAAPWYGSFQNAELRGYVESKGFASPEVLADGYRNLEKLTGVPPDQLLRLPKDDDKAAWDGVWKRLGRPDKPEDYKLPVLEGDSGDFAKLAAQWFHEAGVPAKAAQAIAAKNNEYLKNAMAGMQKVRAEKFAQEEKALMREWGDAAEKNLGLVDAVADKLGIDDKALVALRDAMGPAGAMRFLHNLGAKLGEDTFVSGNGTPSFAGRMSPDAAQARIEQLKADPAWAQKYLQGGATEREEMDRLLKMAYPG